MDSPDKWYHKEKFSLFYSRKELVVLNIYRCIHYIEYCWLNNSLEVQKGYSEITNQWTDNTKFDLPNATQKTKDCRTLIPL